MTSKSSLNRINLRNSNRAFSRTTWEVTVYRWGVCRSHVGC